MYYIEKFNNNFFVCGEGRPKWVGEIDTRQSFGTVYNGWYTEPDILKIVNNTATSASIFQMSKMIYVNNYAYGFAEGQDYLCEINYDNISVPIYTKHDLDKGPILDICLDANDDYYIYIVVGSGAIDTDNMDATLYKCDISNAGTMTLGSPIVFSFNDYPYSDSTEEDPQIEFANIISLGTDIYIMLKAVGDDRMKPWLQTTATETCKFLYKGAYSIGTIDLDDNTPPMPTIRKSSELDDSLRRIVSAPTYVHNMGITTLAITIGTTSDNYAYSGAQTGTSYTQDGNFGFYRNEPGSTDVEFNTVKNTLCIVNGVVGCTLHFDSGSICQGFDMSWYYTGSIAIATLEPNLYDLTDKYFTYFITEDNSIDNLLDNKLTGEQQEMFGTDGTAIVGIQRRAPHNLKISSGAYELSILDGENTTISSNRPDTTDINTHTIVVAKIKTIDDNNLIFDVKSLFTASIYILCAHRNNGVLGIGNYNSCTGILTLHEATLATAFEINDSYTSDAVFDKSIRYKYKLSCLYDGFQEGPLSNISMSPNDLTNWDADGTGNIISLSITLQMQTIPSKRVSHINLYRSDGDAFYRLVKSIPIELFMIDGIYYQYSLLDDGTALASFDALNGYSQELDNVSLNYSIMTQFNGYMYVSGIGALDGENVANYLFRSKAGRYSVYDWSNDFVKTDFQIDIVASFNGDILVANDNNIAIIDSEQMYVKKYIHGTGCDNQYLIKETPYGLVFMGHGTVYVWDGQKLNDIGIVISNSIDDITVERMEYDGKLKKILFFGLFSETELNYYSYSFEERRWDVGAEIDSGTGISVIGSFTDHLGKIYITYNVPTIKSDYRDGTSNYGDKDVDPDTYISDSA